MSQYSIKDLEHLSGIKAHTLRIWEQRYELLSPKRTATNIRFYDNEDLKLLLNVTVLNDHGYRISRIARMTREEMHAEVMRLSQEYCNYPDQIQSLCLAMVDMDEPRFDRVMNSNIHRIGLERTMMDIVYPFLTRIGILWQTGAVNPAQEHFISNLIRQKIITAIDNTTLAYRQGTQKFVLFLPEGEQHEIGLLFAYYMLKSRNHQVYYLGQSLPLDDLLTVVKLVKPDFVFGLFNMNSHMDITDEYLSRLVSELPAGQLVIGGTYLAHRGTDEKGYKRLDSAQDFIQYLESLGTQEAVTN